MSESTVKLKSTGYLFNKFPPVTLYLDDITQIIEVLDKRGVKYSISDIEYNYDSLEDVKSNCSEYIKDLSITAKFDNFDYFMLEFKRGAIILKSSKSDTNTLIFNDIFSIIERRSSWYLRLINSKIFTCTCLLIFLIAWIIKANLVAAIPSQSYWLEVVIVFSSYFYLISFSYNNILKPKIYLKNKEQVKGVSRENYVRLTFVVIGALIGAFAKTIFERIF